MPLSDVRGVRRAVAMATAIVLLAGFAYSGVATWRGYRAIAILAPARGASATIDSFMGPTTLGSADELRDAVRRAGWTPADDVAVVAPVGLLSWPDIGQTFSVSSYVLSPRRVFLVAWCDSGAAQSSCAAFPSTPDPAAELARRGIRRVVLIGPRNPFQSSTILTISEGLRLVAF